MTPTFVDTMLALVDLSAVEAWLPVVGGSILAIALGFAVIKLGKRGISRV